MKNEKPDVAGCLQDAGNVAFCLAKHLMRGAIIDRASPADDVNILLACQTFVDALAAYGAACRAQRLGDDDRDLGPSQGQRL